MSDPLAFRLRALGETTSTNDEVKRAIEAGEPEGLAVRARRQTGGYGRQGRTWASPEGGLYLSLLLRPHVEPAVLPTLTLVAGLAVRRAVASLLPDEAARSVKIKWPNDLVVPAAAVVPTACRPPEPADAARGPRTRSSRDPAGSRVQARFAPAIPRISGTRSPLADSLRQPMREGSGAACDHPDRSAKPSPLRHPERSAKPSPLRHPERSAKRGVEGSFQDPPPPSFRKLCGISVEVHAGGACVGIGVNVDVPAADAEVPVGGKNVPAYLRELGFAGSIGDVADAILNALEPLYSAWQEGGFAPFVDEYAAHAALTGHRVCMANQAGDIVTAGEAVSVDAFGRLVLRQPDGALVPVSSGEAHIL